MLASSLNDFTRDSIAGFFGPECTVPTFAILSNVWDHGGRVFLADALPVGRSWSGTAPLPQGGHRNRGIAKTTELYLKLRVLARAVTLFPVSSLELSDPIHSTHSKPIETRPQLSNTNNRCHAHSTLERSRAVTAVSPGFAESEAPVTPTARRAAYEYARLLAPSWSNHAPVLILARRFLIITQHIHRQPIPQHPEEPRV